MMGAFHAEPVKNQWNSRRMREKPQVHRLSQLTLEPKIKALTVSQNWPAGWSLQKRNRLSLRVFAKNPWGCFKVAGYSVVKPNPSLQCIIFRNGMIWPESYD